MPDEQNDNYSLIAHDSQPRVLLLWKEESWTLPHHTATNPAEINAAMKAQLGLTTTVLSCVYDRYKDEERDEQHRVYALENHSPNVTLPANGRWIEWTELANLPLAVPKHRAVVEAWFDEGAKQERPEQKSPWESLGWFATATTWIHEQLARLGYTPSAPFEQVRTNFWSTALRVPTTTGNLYFKASASVYAFEPLLTETLSRLVPAHVPDVLVVDRQRHWMLMRDGGVPFRSGPYDPDRSVEEIRQYAELQIALAPHVETLKATGCPDQRLHLLPRLYEEVLAATPLLHIDEAKGLPRHEYEQLLAYTPQLKKMCDELASYPIPESLEHDDLHTGNVLANGERYVFFDWGDACLAHPFCSMFIALRDAKYRLGYDDEALARLRQAYLSAWVAYAPMEDLQRAFTLAHRLGSLYRALTWYRLLSRMAPEARWRFEDGTLYFLRVFLGTEE